MAANLTGSKIKDTYSQILHVDGGPSATEKVVYSATGIGTALLVGTNSISSGNIRIESNVISPITGTVGIQNVAVTSGTITGITDLAVADGGTGASTASDARVNLGLGDIATQNANTVAITGGNISATTLKVPSLTGYVKANGASNMSASATIPFSDISGAPTATYAQFSDTTNQTATINTATVVTMNSTDISSNITLVSNSRMTVANPGVYKFDLSVLFANSAAGPSTISFWLRKNGTDIAASNTDLSIPGKSGAVDGIGVCTVPFILSLVGGDYVEVWWSTPATTNTLKTLAAQTSPTRPAMPSVIVTVIRLT